MEKIFTSSWILWNSYGVILSNVIASIHWSCLLLWQKKGFCNTRVVTCNIIFFHSVPNDELFKANNIKKKSKWKYLDHNTEGSMAYRAEQYNSVQLYSIHELILTRSYWFLSKNLEENCSPFIYHNPSHLSFICL